MNKLYVVLIASLLFSSVAFADTYQMTYGWTDPTVYIASDTPVYEAKYRVNAGAEKVIPALATPGGSVSGLVVTPGQTVEVSVRQCNKALCSAWMPWATATAPHAATQPLMGTNLVITIIRTGP